MTTARNGDFQVLNFTPLAELTPRIPKLVSSLGLFTSYYGETTVAQVERVTDGTDDISAKPRGADRNFAGREKGDLYNLNIPFFPLDSRFTAKEIQDFRQYGTADTPKTVEDRVMRTMARIRKSHDLLKEKALYAAIKGTSYSPGFKGADYNYFTTFGTTKKSFAIDFTQDGVDPRITVEKNARKQIIDNAMDDGSSYRVIALVGSDFFNSLITHPLVVGAYDSYPSESEPLRKRLGGDLINRSFETMGVTYIEDISGQIATGDAYFIPLGIQDMFQLHYAPSDTVDGANDTAQEMYVFLLTDNHRTRTVETETSFIAVNTRPELVPVATGNTMRP